MPTDNDIHIALFAAAPNPKPQQSLSVTRAFHTYAFEKIVSLLNGNLLNVDICAKHFAAYNFAFPHTVPGETDKGSKS